MVIKIFLQKITIVFYFKERDLLFLYYGVSFFIKSNCTLSVIREALNAMKLYL